MLHDLDFADPIVAKADGPWADEALMRLWFWACMANTIVPFLMGAGATEGEARGGMLLGVVAVVGGGWLAVLALPEVVRTVVYGAWVVAVAQLFPVLQLMAGVVGLGTVAGLGLGRGPEGPSPEIESLLGGFIGTVVTGCTLIVFAGIFGGLGRAAAYMAGCSVRD